MSMETELKKIAINLQQLTDAVTTLNATMELHKPVVIPDTDASVSKEASGMGGAEIPADRQTAETVVTENKVVDINKNEGVSGATADTVIGDEVADMTMQEANLELQRIVGEIGDGGVAVRDLLKKHNAVSLAQIPAEKYRAFVDEAQALVPAKQA